MFFNYMRGEPPNLPCRLVRPERKAIPMPSPIYTDQNLKPAFHLLYTWTGWPAAGTQFPPEPGSAFFDQLDEAWESDALKRIAVNWQIDKIQFAFSTVPKVSPSLFVARVKGRLQHALRSDGPPVKFSRKVAFRGIGENHSREVKNYIRRQVDKERFVDPRFAELLKRFTILDESVALDEPSATNSGRYWYNLHVVLVVASRERIRSENDFAELDRVVQQTARKHEYKLAARAWMPDHLHVALQGNIAESPGEIAMSLMNNTAYAMGQNAIWQRGF
jgi:REP element-mobilizing transposase RayT